ncbi:hypothetical protein LZD49_28275 [Dyadobacter sp. CY261]|uniref:hypothetical protein n=1 Tax=Dyadobacter sp. CY261 TaxID=2907203 RepID=UPI001F475397|nr:hypothetical protein [Dyadobacter sp. CY261]MCF0074414.1 hypothetical protein [Dyadobacter sp. CY261]
MKTFITSAIIAALAITGAQAQTLAKEIRKENKTEKRAEARNGVSARSKDSFYADFGQVNDAQWSRGPQFDEVTFTKDGQKQTAFYDDHFMLVGTTFNKKFADIPAKAQKEIEKQFKNYAIGAVIEYNDNENNNTNMLLYGTQFEDADHYFVTVTKGKEADVLMVKTDGQVSFFSTLRK